MSTRVLALSCAVTVLGLIGSPATAQTNNFGFFGFASVDNDSKEFNLPDKTGDLSITNATGTVDAKAGLNFGSNKLLVTAAGTDSSNPLHFADIDGIGVWQDTVTISDPSLNGTVGHFN